MNSYNVALLLLSFASQAIAAALKLKANSAQSEEWTTAQEDAFAEKIEAARLGKDEASHWAIEPDPS